MRIEEITDGPEVQVVLKATREEMAEGHWHWHDEVQFVAGKGVVALLEEAAKRLEESDYGIDWSRSLTLKGMAEDIKSEEAVTEQFDLAARKFAAKEKKARRGK